MRLLGGWHNAFTLWKPAYSAPGELLHFTVELKWRLVYSSISVFDQLKKI